MSRQDRQETWKDIPGYEGLYQVSNLGRVKSLPRHGTRSDEEMIMTQHKDGKGYMRLWLCKNCVQKNFKVHRLVASAFLPNPDNLPQINHKDENKQNNSADNLEWCDNRYNSVYNDKAKKVGRKLGKKVKCLETGIVYSSISDAARAFGLTTSSVNYVCHGKYKQVKGYHFAFENSNG